MNMKTVAFGNLDGQLGNGNQIDSLIPVPVMAPQGRDAFNVGLEY